MNPPENYVSIMRSVKPHSDQDAVSPTTDKYSQEEYKETISGDVLPAPLSDASPTPATTPAMRRKGWIQFATLCWSIYVAGWNDGTLGPLLPRLQEVYHVSGTYASAICIAKPEDDG